MSVRLHVLRVPIISISALCCSHYTHYIKPTMTNVLEPDPVQLNEFHITDAASALRNDLPLWSVTSPALTAMFVSPCASSSDDSCWHQDTEPSSFKVIGVLP